MPSAARSVVIYHNDFEQYVDGFGIGIGVRARAGVGVNGSMGARSEGSDLNIENGWLGSAFGIGIPLTTRRYGEISGDWRPHQPPLNTSELGSSLIIFYTGLVIIGGLSHHVGPDADAFSFSTAVGTPNTSSPGGVNPQTDEFRNIKLQWRTSTLAKTDPLFPDRWYPQPDGYAIIYVNNVEAFRVENAYLAGANWYDQPNVNVWFNVIKISPSGVLDNVSVLEYLDDVVVPDAGQSCAGPGTDLNETDPNTTPPTSFIPTPPATFDCVGDGTVPEGGQGGPGENWAL